MSDKIEDTRTIQERDRYDVIVVGGGIAGISAAVAAARTGASVLLLEKTVVLGGLATVGLISWYEPLCDGSGKQMVSGISEELIRLAIRYGFDDLPQDWREQQDTGSANDPRSGRYASHFSPTLFAMSLDGYLNENGVDIRLDTMAIFPVMEGKHCGGIVTESAGGREFFGAKVVVDATGNATVLHRAGVPTVNGKNYLTYVAHYTDLELARKYAEDQNMAAFRKWLMVGSDLFGKGHPEGMERVSGVTGNEVTRFVLSGRQMLFDRIKDQPRDRRDITMLPMMPQLRTIRRLDGAYVFTGEEEGRTFEDAVGSMGDFRSRGKHYQLPYASLYHRDFDNLLAAGRIISADGNGWEITRVIPVAALSGQAAGTAAGLCVASGTEVGAIDIGLLQNRLQRDGVLF